MTPGSVEPADKNIDYQIMPITAMVSKPLSPSQVLSSYELEHTVTVSKTDLCGKRYQTANVSANRCLTQISEMTVTLDKMQLPTAFYYDITLEHKGKSVLLFEAYQSGIYSNDDKGNERNVGWGESPFSTKDPTNTIGIRCADLCSWLTSCSISIDHATESITAWTRSMCGAPGVPDHSGCKNSNANVSVFICIMYRLENVALFCSLTSSMNSTLTISVTGVVAPDIAVHVRTI